jgi:hypothetical protein
VKLPLRLLAVGFLTVLASHPHLAAQSISESGIADVAFNEPQPLPVTNALPVQREVAYGDAIHGGTVIVRGEVLSPPYRVGQIGRKVLINDVLVAMLPGTTDERGRERPDRSRVSPKHFVANVETRLYNGDVLICFDDRTRVFCYSGDEPYFLQALIQAENLEERVLAALDYSVGGFDDSGSARIPTSQWRTALADFEPTDSLLQFIEVSGINDEEGDYLSEDDEAYQRSDPTRWMYALNVAGMLLVVVSAGKLLGNRPESGIPWAQIVESPDATRLSRDATVMILLLSSFDLVATLLTDSSGGFTELNPLTGSLLKNPAMLAVFKLTATGLGTGILWHRRKFAGAQQAAWWMCFLLTLVTIRWVTIQSLFYV